MGILRLKRVHGTDYENFNAGYALYEDEAGRQYSGYVGRGNTPDPRFWATLNQYWERDLSIFTREYCKYQGIDRPQYTQIEIIG